MIRTPYLLFLGDAPDRLAAKVAQGIRDWRPDHAVGQLRLPGCAHDLGLPDMSVQEARDAGARTMVIGVANRGGVISQSWRAVLADALRAGLDLASGLHNLLRDDPVLSAIAEERGRAMHDVRVPERDYPIADGVPRAGLRCLTVGTDCSVGKMYTTLAIDAEMRARGIPSDFRATGQTGILITGEGVPLDAVVADFMAGAVEAITPPSAADHWDLIEGQGSVFHISFSGVTMALIHGGQPDALILCEEPTREQMRGLAGRVPPDLAALRDVTVPLARIANPACVAAGISVNTHHMEDAAARDYLARTEDTLGLPAVDPFRHGAGRLVDALEAVARSRQAAE